jgi:hypothetical protein
MRRRPISPRQQPRRKRRPISEHEQTRRAQQREQSLAAIEPLLYSRRQTARVLGNISVATIQRLEARGVLDKIRLAGSPNGAVYHRAEQVHALAEGNHAE